MGTIGKEKKILKIARESISTSTHHKLVVDTIRLLPSGWRKVFTKYIEKFMKGSKTPDDKFKDFRNHVYFPDKKWGGGPASVEKWYKIAVEMLKRKRFKEAVYCFGIMSHYFADILQPLHTGVRNDEPPVHKALEYATERIYDGKIHPHLNLKLKPGSGTPKELAIKAAILSHKYYDTFMDNFDLKKAERGKPEDGLDKKLIRDITGLLSNAAVNIAHIIKMGIEESGVKAPRVRLRLKIIGTFFKRPIKTVFRRVTLYRHKRKAKSLANEMKKRGKLKKLPGELRELWNLLGITDPSRKKGKKTYKFNYEPDDDISVAPIISMKIKDTLRLAGIYTLYDLIYMPTSLIKRRCKKEGTEIDRKEIKRWKRFARLACSLPEVNPRDINLLLAIGIKKPAKLRKYTLKRLRKKLKKAVKKGKGLKGSDYLPSERKMRVWLDYVRGL